MTESEKLGWFPLCKRVYGYDINFKLFGYKLAFSPLFFVSFNFQLIILLLNLLLLIDLTQTS